MHQGIADWVRATLLPDMIRGKRVLEVGSRDVVGTMRPWIEEHLLPAEYLGIDIVEGESVDEILDAKSLLDKYGSERWDVVLCLEMLEHCEGWQEALYQMKESLTLGGWLILTTRSPGYPYHSPPDLWRFSKEVLIDSMEELEDLATWSDCGYVSERTDEGKPKSFNPQPGVFIRGRRTDSPIKVPKREAEPAPPENETIYWELGFGPRS